ncbi:MAG TPA: hypothetical protein VM686_19950 [Polyangiaceae bacterium]|nr:hypothetical protein [Polyangiaceae bacterium]
MRDETRKVTAAAATMLAAINATRLPRYDGLNGSFVTAGWLGGGGEGSAAVVGSLTRGMTTASGVNERWPAAGGGTTGDESRTTTLGRLASATGGGGAGTRGDAAARDGGGGGTGAATAGGSGSSETAETSWISSTGGGLGGGASLFPGSGVRLMGRGGEGFGVNDRRGSPDSGVRGVGVSGRLAPPALVPSTGIGFWQALQRSVTLRPAIR